MRAVRVDGPGQVAVVEMPAPEPGEGEVVVRVTYAGVCGTDRKLVSRGTVVVPGHEAVGYLPDGSLVGIHPDIGCGACDACRRGWHNRCPDRVSVGIDRDGALAEAVTVPSAHVVPIEGLEPALGPLLEPLACCLQAIGQLDVRSGEAALVVGAGAMGVLCTWALQAAGVRVTVVQRSPERRALAGRLGADAVLGPSDSLDEAPTVAIVAAPGAAALEYALAVVATGGRVHAFAGTPDGAPVDANLVHYRHLTLVGGTGSRLTDYRQAVALAAAGDVDLDRLPRMTVPLDEAPSLLLAAPACALKGLVRL